MFSHFHFQKQLSKIYICKYLKLNKKLQVINARTFLMVVEELSVKLHKVITYVIWMDKLLSQYIENAILVYLHLDKNFIWFSLYSATRNYPKSCSISSDERNHCPHNGLIILLISEVGLTMSMYLKEWKMW